VSARTMRARSALAASSARSCSTQGSCAPTACARRTSAHWSLPRCWR
jgi:hypothetical protein